MNTKLDFETIDMLSKGITQYAFRSGLIEEMQAKNKLTHKDMETLNKDMVNRIAGLLTVIYEMQMYHIKQQLLIKRCTQNNQI